jgi:hypothetical protein
MHHELNEVLGIKFPLPSTELQSYGHTTCSTRHQNTVTAITICTNDMVTSAPPSRHAASNCTHTYMYSFKRDSAMMGKINKQLIYQINHNELIHCKCRVKSVLSINNFLFQRNGIFINNVTEMATLNIL